MSNLWFVLLGLAVAVSIVAVYLMLKAKKTGAVVKEGQLEALGLGKESNVTP
jgi:hypothetical protein